MFGTHFFYREKRTFNCSIKVGVGVLDDNKLPSLIDLNYRTVRDAAEELGNPESIRDLFVNFQKYMYESVSVA